MYKRQFDECLVLVPPLQTIARALPALLQDFRKPESIGHVELFHGTASALLLRHTTALVDEDRQRLAAFCSAHQAPVSYTHLDVYKRQPWCSRAAAYGRKPPIRGCACAWCCLCLLYTSMLRVLLPLRLTSSTSSALIEPPVPVTW